MKKTLIALIIATVVLLLTACQPTPDIEPVVGKNKLEEKISETNEFSQSHTYPEKWTQDFQNDEGHVTIQIDAVLEVPDVSVYPVVNVVPTEITKDDIEK